jgi:hypothetical protein
MPMGGTSTISDISSVSPSHDTRKGSILGMRDLTSRGTPQCTSAFSSARNRSKSGSIKRKGGRGCEQ